jgi:hypothetical protein
MAITYLGFKLLIGLALATIAIFTTIAILAPYVERIFFTMNLIFAFGLENEHSAVCLGQTFNDFRIAYEQDDIFGEDDLIHFGSHLLDNLYLFGDAECLGRYRHYLGDGLGNLPHTLIFTIGAMEDFSLNIFPRTSIGGVTTHLALLHLLKAIFAEGLFIAIYITIIFIRAELTAMSTLLIILTLIAISAYPIFSIFIASALIVLPTIFEELATATIGDELELGLSIIHRISALAIHYLFKLHLIARLGLFIGHILYLLLNFFLEIIAMLPIIFTRYHMLISIYLNKHIIELLLPPCFGNSFLDGGMRPYFF